jgi:dihydrofolate reductase
MDQAMRKVTFGVANSLDNFIARTDHGIDWLYFSDDVTKIMKEFWKNVDTVLMGRKTYEVSLRMGGGRGGLFPGVKSYIFSRTLKPADHPLAEIVSEDAAAFVRKLKDQPGKDICCMGGGELAKSLFEAGLIDEIGLNVHPVLLGSGIPLFLEMNRQVDLELLGSRPLKGGCVLLSYRVKK